ncbi:hypothetical protein F511_07733 [Dorcoceras hygrometricum]|uniref:Uncharacterized protein n=1 Tax=Dorcoceras hygrometricum TaxID=472368 RepID=A0A2Z7CJM5_9LAMI|nr:hypothetical protein F511_07733 [Dorcoceras hygrometricum]
MDPAVTWWMALTSKSRPRQREDAVIRENGEELDESWEEAKEWVAVTDDDEEDEDDDDDEDRETAKQSAAGLCFTPRILIWESVNLTKKMIGGDEFAAKHRAEEEGERRNDECVVGVGEGVGFLEYMYQCTFTRYSTSIIFIH